MEKSGFALAMPDEEVGLQEIADRLTREAVSSWKTAGIADAMTKQEAAEVNK